MGKKDVMVLNTQPLNGINSPSCFNALIINSMTLSFCYTLDSCNRKSGDAKSCPAYKTCLCQDLASFEPT